MLLRPRKIVLSIMAAGLLAGFAIICVAQESTNQDPEGMRRTVKQLRSENELLRGRVLELEKRLEGQSVRDR